jgi:competence protein ComEC
MHDWHWRDVASTAAGWIHRLHAASLICRLRAGSFFCRLKAAASSMRRWLRSDPLPSRPLVVMALGMAGGCALPPCLVAADIANPGAVSWWLGAVVALGGWLACSGLFMVQRHCRSTAAMTLVAAVVCSGAAWATVCFDLFPATDIGWQLGDSPQPVALEGILVSAPRVLPTPPSDRFGIDDTPSSECVVQVERMRSRSSWRTVTGLASVIIEGDSAHLSPGARIRLFGRGLRPAAAGNPGEFDCRERARGRRCLAIVRVRTISDVRVLDDDAGGLTPWLAGTTARIRAWSADVFERHLTPSRAPLAAALLLGIRETLPQEDIDAFLLTGTIHVLSISGLHVGLLAAGFYRLLRVVVPSRRWALVGVAVGTGLYMLLVRAETPVVRATLVVWLAALAAALGRRSPALNALAAAAIIVLICRPAEVTSAGPQLSFLSTAVLIGVAHVVTRRQPPDPIDRLIERSRPRVVRWLRGLGRAVAIGLVAGVAVWVATAPLVAARFHVLSPLAIALNVIVAPLVPVAMGCGLGCLATALVAPPVAGVFGLACDGTLALLQWIVTWGATASWGHVWLPTPPTWWWVGWYAWLAMACFLLPGARLRRPATWIAVAASWCFIGLGMTAALRLGGPAPAGLRVIVAALGHGCGIVVRAPTGRTLVYDAGRLGAPAAARRAVAGILWNEGVTRIDTLVISHADTDHFNAVPGLLERFTVGEIVVSPAFLASRSASVQNLLREAATARVPVRQVRGGDAFAVDPHCRVRVLRAGVQPAVVRQVGWRSAEWRAADNEASIVMSVEAAGRRVVLTGDLEGRALGEFVAAGPDSCDVLVAPHHGTRTSLPPDIARVTRPEWVVVSGRGGSSWPEVRDAYLEHAAAGFQDHASAVGQERATIGVLKTGGEGAIALTLRADRIAVERFTCGRWQPTPPRQPAVQPGTANRPDPRKPLGRAVAPATTKSARISPTTLANLKPCPEKPAAIDTRGSSGWRSRRKWPSGDIVYRQVA